MDFLQLHARNFLTIGDSGPLLLSGRGLNVIQGDNGDDSSATSNGAGKSSIPDALSWALFGVTARGESGDDVINRTAKKDCSVESIFRDGETLYSVTRYRKHSTHKNAVALKVFGIAAAHLLRGGDRLPPGVYAMTDLSKGTDRETQAEIERVLGCSHPVFTAAIYAGQEQMPDLPAMTDKQLKTLIEEAAGVERLSAAYAIARQKGLDAERALEGKTATAASLAVEVLKEKDRITKAEEDFAAFEAARPAKVNAFEQKANLGDLTIAKLIAQIRAVDGAALLARRDELNVGLSGHAEAVATAANHRKTVIAPLEKQIAQEEHDLARLTREFTAFDARCANVEGELSRPCDACGKPHTADEVEELRAHLLKLADAKSDERDSVRAVLVAYKTSLQGLKDHQTILEAAVPDVTAATAELTALNAQIIAVNSTKAKAREGAALIKTWRDDAKREQTAPNPHHGSMLLLKERLAELEKRLAATNAEVEKLDHALQIQKDVAVVFGPAGVRAHILDTVTPFLNERTAEYLSTLSDGHISAVWTTLSRTKAGELREKFTIDVENDAGAKTFKGLSGGEKRKVRLATTLALQDLVASRASKPINLWIGDEVDDALDEAGLERLMSILETKAREKGTVIVISHNSLTDWCDSVTTITKKGGYSTVEGALCG